MTIPEIGSVYRGSMGQYHGWRVIAADRCRCSMYCLGADETDRVQVLVENPENGMWRILWDARPTSFELT